MALKEVIDGPIPYDRRVRVDTVAAEISRSLLRSLDLQELEDPYQDGDQSFRLASWVETEDSKIGYALAITAPETARSEVTEESLALAYFYTIDRDNHTLIGAPKKIALQKESLLEALDRDELDVVNSMLRKSALAGPAADSGADKHILLALMDAHLGELANLFPSSSESIDDKSTESPHMNVEFITAAQKLFSETESKGSSYKEVAIKKVFPDTTYVIHLTGEGDIIHFVDLLQNVANKWSSELHTYIPEEEHEIAQGSSLPWQLQKLIRTLKEGSFISPKLVASYLEEGVGYISDEIADNEAYALSVNDGNFGRSRALEE